MSTSDSSLDPDRASQDFTLAGAIEFLSWRDMWFLKRGKWSVMGWSDDGRHPSPESKGDGWTWEEAFDKVVSRTHGHV